MSEIIYISNARLSFPNLVEPQVTTDPVTGKQRISYNCEFILAPNDPQFAAFMKRLGEIAVAEWKENAQAAMGIIQSDRKLRCYGRGEEKINKKTFQPYDGYPGNVFISAGNKFAPQMIQADGKPVDPANTMAYQALARKLYGGCYVNAAVKPWPQKNKHGNGLRCDLIAIQFLKDGASFGAGSVDASGVFGAVDAAPAPAANGIAGLPPFMLS